MSNNQSTLPLKDVIKEDITFKMLIVSFKEWLFFLAGKWKIILFWLFIGTGAGAAIQYFSKPVFSAQGTFSMESSESPNLGALSLLNVGGASGAGLFDEIDNIMWLYSSDAMVRRTLLSRAFLNGKEDLLINEYLVSNPSLNKKLKKIVRSDKIAIAQKADSLYERNENLIINSCVAAIKSKQLIIEPEKKTENIVRVTFISSDEILSKVFVEQIMDIVNRFYISTKTQKEQEEVALLQRKVDSIKAVLGSSIAKTARQVDNVPYANPFKEQLRTGPKESQIDVESSAGIYAELVKSLEASKAGLEKEMPLVQIIDRPYLPLPKQNLGIIKGAVIGGIVFGFIGILIIIARRMFKKAMS